MSENNLVESFLDKLEDNMSYEREVYVKSSVADIVINKNIAIEAKLKDIRKALSQAYSYKSKYKYVYILIPKSSTGIIRKWEDILMRNKIRWMFLDEDNSISFGRNWWKDNFNFK